MPSILGVAALVICTILEERMLHEELEGYKEYV